MADLYLCADIGATNARFAAVRADGEQLQVVQRIQLASAAHASVVELLQAARNQLAGEFSAIALALPGPVMGGCCRVTLLPWLISEVEIEQATGLPCRLLNDLEAQGWGIDQLAASELVCLTPERTGQPGNRCIIAPGSDLGEAILYWDGQQHRPFPTEGGHCDFAPSDELEWQLAELLMEQYGQARWGDLLSGRGIVALYRMLAADSSCCKSGEDIADLANQGDSAAAEAIARFLRLLGREAANLGLKSMALDGVYIAGGIVPSLPRPQVQSLVLEGFDAKPSMAHLLQTIPLRLICSDNLGILGCGRFLRQNPRRDLGA
ncbi:MAG: ROK family protein [Gammaproteobacteria bacterium]|nr:ROK family protein [Gammaproteobacteria bacterium]